MMLSKREISFSVFAYIRNIIFHYYHNLYNKAVEEFSLLFLVLRKKSCEMKAREMFNFLPVKNNYVTNILTLFC